MVVARMGGPPQVPEPEPERRPGSVREREQESVQVPVQAQAPVRAQAPVQLGQQEPASARSRCWFGRPQRRGALDSVPDSVPGPETFQAPPASWRRARARPMQGSDS